jgi:hypothetical protein
LMKFFYSFLFFFSLVTKCVCCQYTHQGGRLRTGGWSLPGVMSD